MLFCVPSSTPKKNDNQWLYDLAKAYQSVHVTFDSAVYEKGTYRAARRERSAEIEQYTRRERTEL